MPRLFTDHLLSLQSSYSDLKRLAGEQETVFVGTPGSVTERTVNGKAFLYRQYYDPADRKAAEYLGPSAAATTAARADALRERIASTKGLLDVARVLARAGYVRVDARVDAVVAALFNHGVFRAGGVVVGSHAYGILLNELGVRAAAYGTEDVDIARRAPLRLPTKTSFDVMLADAKLGLLPVPQLDRKKPSTSYKPAGADRFRVDLLVPTSGSSVKVLEAKDLGVFATALPHFQYVLEDPLEAIVIGRSSVVPVNVPRPERLGWHKLLVSELRAETNDKRTKDVAQATVLLALTAERDEDATRDALRALAPAPRAKAKKAARAVLERLEGTPHARALQTLRAILG